MMPGAPCLLVAIVLCVAAPPPTPPASPPAYTAAFQSLYNDLARLYPCFDLKGIDWGDVGRELLPRAKSITSDHDFGLLCRELIARLEDNHAVLLKGTAEPPWPDLPRFDPGFSCLLGDEGLPVVYVVEPNGPAARAGIRVGMTVTSMNGRPITDVIDETQATLSKWVGYSSARRARYDAVRGFHRHAQDEFVIFEMTTPDGVAQGFRVPATMEPRYVPRLPVPIEGIRDTADLSFKRLDDDTGYIYVRRIRADLAPGLDAALEAMPGITRLVIDVRGNTGGGFDRAEAHVNFDPDAPAELGRPRFDGPIALLIDARCVSAGEGWASWFVATKRARLFGEATNGASARKIEIDVAGGLYRARVPVKAYTGFLDRPIERRGLEPDVPVLPAAADLAAGRDTVLEAARLWLAAP